MSGAYPVTIEFSAINLTSENKNLASETASGRRQVRSIGAQRWSFTAKYSPMTRADFMPIYAFVVSQKGQLETFTVIPPVISDTSGDITGTVLTSSTHLVGDDTIAVDGMTGTIKAGDFIKFASHTKVYMVTADATASTGAATLTIEPPLTTALGNDEAMTYNDVAFTVRLNSDIQSYSLDGFEKYNYEIDFLEAL